MSALPQTSPAPRDALCYALAALCGIGTGLADVLVNDLLFTALLVLSACMVLGMLRPRWPWRWVVAVVVFIPLTEWIAYLLRAIKPTNGQIWGSFLVALPGIAGAYGGAVARRALDELRPRK
jgi:ABC-type multidrug transport system permease subunit